MELLVGCALVIVVYCGYLTARDIVTDLQREGSLRYGFSLFPHRSAVLVKVRHGAKDNQVRRTHPYHD